MPKVNTLLKLIAYQKEHPQATDEDIAEGIGLSPRHIIRCRKDVNLLKHQLADSHLQPEQIQFLLSLLKEHATDQKEIAQQLQEQMGIFYTGCLRTAHPDEEAPVGWLGIGELIPAETAPSDRLHPALNFWLQSLCYDPLLVYHRNGEIEGRLVVTCEAVKGNSQWQLTLREDLRWSDGKPITLEEVIAAFSESRIASSITEIKPDGKTQLRVQLSQEEGLFPLHLSGIFVHPSHSPQPYRVTSGPYQLKRFHPDAGTFRLQQNKDYYRGGDPQIDWLTLRRFTHLPNAVKALENGALDLLSVSPQQQPPVNSGPFLRTATTFYFSTVIAALYRIKGTVIFLKKQSTTGRLTSIFRWDRLMKKGSVHNCLACPLTFKSPARMACFTIWLN